MMARDMMEQSEMATIYEELRPLLFSIAYRMLGSIGEAEDIVQEAFLRFHRASQEEAQIESPKAYLSTVVTRLSIDHLRSARARRERYVGQWLPEPLLTDTAADASEHAVIADSLSLAFLVLLESLSPVERAVFLLHDVFGYGYDEIARIIGKSEQNCRQLAVRARRHIEGRRPRFEASQSQREQLAQRFFAAVEQGDTEGLIHLLAAEVVVYGDGGGTVPSWPHPIEGRDRVSRLLAGLGAQAKRLGLRIQPTELNGQPGAMFLDPEGRLINVMSLDIADGLIQTVRSIINPDKLGHLGPLADVRALLRERRGQTPGGPQLR
jgi:RNA polymerase sigma-70 factor (ECF subfamily)